ncbi:hypothetical protein [Knoellia koreensis]|uniref:Uncharacterized protein n=1 Tax=Knoellia koreensis TaxID=2730921 RepID=A0A849HMG4_9MICO|nr:hypothetical protein [Knoellia sp. DB2414S]NNM47724.1 hypothetical protein [Knoellia sp. DB2414S]
MSASAALAAYVIAVNLFVASRGLDRTDEGMYLNAIRHPGDDVATVLLFGYVYHPAYAALGGDIVRLRWFGMLLTVVVGAVSAWALLGLPRLVGRLMSRGARVVLAGVIGATGLFVYLSMPLSPGYNSLALQALLVVATGLGLAMFGGGWRAGVGWGLIGVGGWLVFLAKPTSAAAVAGLLVVVALVNVGRWLHGLPWAVLGLGLAAAPLLLTTSVGSLYERIVAGAEVSRANGSHDELIRWDAFLDDRAFAFPAVAVVGLVALGISFAHLRLPAWLAWPPLLLAVAVAGFASWWWIRTDQTPLVIAHAPTMSLALLALPVLAVLPRWAAPVRGVAGGRSRERVAVGSFVVFLVLLPLTAAFGSNNNLWVAQGRMTVFWVLATTLLLVRRSTLLGTIPALATQLLLAAYMVGAVLSPYRYPSALAAETPAQLTASGATGRLTAEDTRHLGELLALGSRLGIDDDTWILDLTGENPGLIHSLGARAVGQAWILGGYPRSAAGAELVLRLDACRLRTALVMDAPEGPRRLDPSVLEAVGLSLERDYEEVGTFQWMRWEGSTQSARFIPGRILQPKEELRVVGCSEQH